MKAQVICSRRRGFAIIAVLSMLVLIVMMAVGLLSLSTVSLRTSGREDARNIARANARMGLAIAFGELQKHLGPDKRISARAGTMARHPKLGTRLPENEPKNWWVGVCDSDPSANIGPGGEQPVIWLVSGLSGGSSAGQLEASLDDPVTIVGSGSLDLEAMTGGQPVQVGRVGITDRSGQVVGGYAYHVDDEGMKAQLAAANPLVMNGAAAPAAAGHHGGGLLPGTYPLAVLDRMGGLDQASLDDYLKLPSAGSLPLVGLGTDVARSKYFSYTSRSQGILADVKTGGLKKDLTIAFENSVVYSRNITRSKPATFFVMDQEKFASSELKTSGYIHWDIFRDYYNLKKAIKVVNGVPSLDATTIDKRGLIDGVVTGVYTGQVGPHVRFGLTAASHSAHPYGDYSVFPTSSAYRHNPITPVLASMRQNAWLQYGKPAGSGAATIRTNVQMFTSHYNPYNIGLLLYGDDPTAHTGPRVHSYPQVYFSVDGTSLNRKAGLSKLEAHAKGGVVLPPGRSQVMGFARTVTSGSESDANAYSSSVQQITLESVVTENKLTAALSSPVTTTVEFGFTKPAMMHGFDHAAPSSTMPDYEVSQVFYTPFAWDHLSSGGAVPSPGRVGRKVVWTGVAPSDLNENRWAGSSFDLRTTCESGSSIRPLMDANIRAIWNNPRWDSSLGLPLLAGYSETGADQPADRLFQMDTSEAPKGFTFLGADHERPAGVDRVILFDIPREDLVSIAQLQHASAGRFSYEPSYIVGNSYANPRIPLGSWKAAVTDTYSVTRKLPWTIPGSFNLYDASYLVNERIWDSYIFTTIPQAMDNFTPGETAPDYEALLAGTALLPNPRFIPYAPTGSSFAASVLKDVGDASGTKGSYHHNAGHLLVDGAFNVNSTSVDAWEAFLTGTYMLPFQKIDKDGKITGFSTPDEVRGVRFPRTKANYGSGTLTKELDGNYWTGFRDLTQPEVRDLATRIVEQVRLRGPFLSLGDFVNRKLEASDLGKSGALQAALDATVNKGLNPEFGLPADSSRFPTIPEGSNQGAGFPGQILQGDVLQALSPYMQVRSDTFKIRAYGESRNPDSGEIEARVWCEALVQRLPDPMADSSSTRTIQEELSSPGSVFGRRFIISSFRWLAPSEV